MIHPNPPADGLHQTSPDTHTLIRQGQPTHTIRKAYGTFTSKRTTSRREAT